MQPNYDPESVRPMWEELAGVGVQPATTTEQVDACLSQKNGTVLVVVNSVCGCAAGGARPGVALALQHTTIPDKSITVFAGMDHEAVNRARSYMTGIAPSSPAIALFKDGQLVFMLERHHIEQMNVQMVAQSLIDAFDLHCSAKGPSVPPEVYTRNIRAAQCGSSLPQYPGS